MSGERGRPAKRGRARRVPGVVAPSRTQAEIDALEHADDKVGQDMYNFSLPGNEMAGRAGLLTLLEKVKGVAATVSSARPACALPRDVPEAWEPGGVLVLGSKPNKGEAREGSLTCFGSGVGKIRDQLVTMRVPARRVTMWMISPLAFDGDAWNESFARLFFPYSEMLMKICAPRWVVCVDSRAYKAMLAHFKPERLPRVGFRAIPQPLTENKLADFGEVRALIVSPGHLYSRPPSPLFLSAMKEVANKLSGAAPIAEAKEAAPVRNVFQALMSGKSVEKDMERPMHYKELFGGAVIISQRPTAAQLMGALAKVKRVFNMCVEPIPGDRMFTTSVYFQPEVNPIKDDHREQFGEYYYRPRALAQQLEWEVERGFSPDDPIGIFCDTGVMGTTVAVAALAGLLVPLFEKAEELVQFTSNFLDRAFSKEISEQIAEMVPDLYERYHGPFAGLEEPLPMHRMAVWTRSTMLGSTNITATLRMCRVRSDGHAKAALSVFPLMRTRAYETCVAPLDFAGPFWFVADDCGSSFGKGLFLNREDAEAAAQELEKTMVETGGTAVAAKAERIVDKFLMELFN